MPNITELRAAPASAPLRLVATTAPATLDTPALHSVHNRLHTTAPCRVPLMGVRQTLLDDMLPVLERGPITLDLLHRLLADGFAATPLARLVGDELSARCALPDALCAQEQAAWRDVLLHALRLTPHGWALQAAAVRGDLSHAGAQSHPLLVALRDELYRPHDIDGPAWQREIAAHAAADSHEIARDHQRAQLAHADTQTRHAWAHAALKQWAPQASDAALARAMQDIRRQEQRERGLLDPRVGLRSLLEQGAVDTLHDLQPLSLACAATDGATAALAALLLDCSEAVAAPGAAVVPLGRYDTVARALTSLLSVPGQLEGLRTFTARMALANERVQVAYCTPVPDPDDPVRLHQRVMDGLIGAPAPGTALAPRDHCHVQERNVSGLQVLQAGQIQAFMRRQVPRGADADALQRAYAQLLAAQKVIPPAPVAAADTTARDATTVPAWTSPRAYAGALTDHGARVDADASPTPLLPGASAQLLSPVIGHAPLLLLQGLINSIHTPSWWQALPGHVGHSPLGLLTALDDLFDLAGTPLHGRQPDVDTLQQFFDSTHGIALFEASERMPELAAWQRDEIDRGGLDTRIYAFMRMLKQLMGHLHKHPAEHAALHRLARIGLVAGELLQQYSPHAPDAGQSYFRRVLQKTRSAAAHDPTPPNGARIQAHARRVRPPRDGCPPISDAELRAWLVDAPDPVLTEAGFQQLSEADRCVAQTAVIVARLLGATPPTDWRGARSTQQQWRTVADQLVQTDTEARTWEAAVGVYFHRIASNLRAAFALPQAVAPGADVLNLRTYLRQLIEPLQQLYSALEMPLDRADPHYPEGYASLQAFFAATGNEPAAAEASAMDGHALVRALCPTGAASLRDGLVAVLHQAISARLVQNPGNLPALWPLIVDGPHALQQWLDSDEGRTRARQWLQAMHGTALAGAPLDAPDSLSWQSLAMLIRTAVLSQLPTALQDQVPTLEAIPALFAHGNAPVLSLATQLAEHDRSLMRDPLQALVLAIALLPYATPAGAARMPLRFPVWPSPLPAPSAPVTLDADTALLPEHWLAVPELPAPTRPSLDTSALPALDVLMAHFGLDLIHAANPGTALRPADAWELISRTQAFAALGQHLPPQSAQIQVAQAMLQHYVGHAALQLLRERFNTPDIVQQTFTVLLAEVRDIITARQPQASPAAVDLLQWLVLRELGQPALLVSGVPEGLHNGGTLQAVGFMHGVEMLEAMQPGASAYATYLQLSALPAQLAGPPARAGEHDALYDAWARALLPAAVLFAIAHGQLPQVTRLDAVTAEQAAVALAYLQAAQERRALHMGQIGTPPPRRTELAARTLRAAKVDPAFWSMRPAELPAGYLDQHGIVPAPLLDAEQGLLDHAEPDWIPGSSDVKTRVLTANDSLQMLIAADAYLWTGGPSTRSLFDTTFEIYRRKVESGLAGLIEDLLQSLPEVDRALLGTSTCTPLRVSAFGHNAYQGLLLRCQPAGGLTAFHLEVIPSAGIARRAWNEPGSGEWIELQSLIDGSCSVGRTDRLVPLTELTVMAADTPVDLRAPQALRVLAEVAARQLWDPRLDEVRIDALNHHTRLEAVWEEEKNMATAVAEFTVPFFSCAERLADGDLSTATIAGCALDAVGLIPAGEIAVSTVRALSTAGEHTVISLTTHTGQALLAMGREIASQSGVFLIRDLGKGALWIGSQAWNSALHGAGWLQQVLRGEHALGSSMQALETQLAHGTVPPAVLESFDPATGTLAVARVGDAPPALVISGAHGWHRFDPVEGAAYGPVLEGVGLTAPYPLELPTTPVDNGVRVLLGDGTDARFVERADDHWEIWIGDTPYLLDPAEGSLRLRETHGGELGELQALDGSGCRVERGVEAVVDAAPCVRTTQLQFVPDRRVPLPASPSVEDLQHHAFGYRRYAPAAVAQPGSLQPGATETTPLMVHNGKVCQWHSPLSRQNRPLPPRLSPLLPEEADALGVPATVDYLPTLGGQRRPDSTLGLPDDVDEATRTAVNAQVPVIEIGPLVKGIGGSREVRGIRMPVNGLPSICIEPDAGVFYAATAIGDGEVLEFVRLNEKDTINRYLRNSEAQRLYRENPQSAQLRRNIAEMTFDSMRRTFSAEQQQKFPTYEAYVTYYAAHGYPDVLDRYAEKVLSGKAQQAQFIRMSRQLIPDWKALQACPLEERQEVADLLNTLLPLEGKEADWTPLTGESLALPETAQQILQHIAGANLAVFELETTSGQRVYYALSSGQRARKLTLVPPPSTPARMFFDAQKSGLPQHPKLASLPVLRHEEDTRTIVFAREGDSENVIVRAILDALESDDPLVHVDPKEIKQVKVVSVLGLCSSCGGVVVRKLKTELERLGSSAGISIRYLIDYVK